MSETWKPLPELDGYEVSDLGRVRSLKTHHGIPGPRILSQYTRYADRYQAVTLSTPSGVVVRTVHTLVALAFHGERPDGYLVRHLNGDSVDNRATNIAYGTPSQNLYDAVNHGTHHWAARTHCKHGHPFDDENTKHYVRPDGRRQRVCLACRSRRIAERTEQRRLRREAELAVVAETLQRVGA